MSDPGGGCREFTKCCPDGAGYQPSYYSGDGPGYNSPGYNYYGGNSYYSNPGSYGYDTGAPVLLYIAWARAFVGSCYFAVPSLRQGLEEHAQAEPGSIMLVESVVVQETASTVRMAALHAWWLCTLCCEKQGNQRLHKGRIYAAVLVQESSCSAAQCPSQESWHHDS